MIQVDIHAAKSSGNCVAPPHIRAFEGECPRSDLLAGPSHFTSGNVHWTTDHILPSNTVSLSLALIYFWLSYLQHCESCY